MHVGKREEEEEEEVADEAEDGKSRRAAGKIVEARRNWSVRGPAGFREREADDEVLTSYSLVKSPPRLGITSSSITDPTISLFYTFFFSPVPSFTINQKKILFSVNKFLHKNNFYSNLIRLYLTQGNAYLIQMKVKVF